MFEPNLLIERLKGFKIARPLPLQGVWPIHRRAATLVLLFIGAQGELRILLTKRCRSLRSFSGHVSLPGGKSDNLSETADEIARRESEEEISLPRSDSVLLEKYNMKMDALYVDLPHYLARNFLSVRPVVYFLYNSNTAQKDRYQQPLDGSKFFGKLNPGETSSIFSIPLSDLDAHDKKWSGYQPEYLDRKEYHRVWGGLPWLVQHLYYPNENAKDAAWLNSIVDTSSGDEDLDGVPCKNVWGLTAKILQDICCIAHGDITSNDVIGHDDLIYALHEFGSQMNTKSRSAWENDMLMNKPGVKFSDTVPAHLLEAIMSRTSEF